VAGRRVCALLQALGKGTFTRPQVEAGSTTIKWTDLVLMLEGIQVKAYVKKERYEVAK